MKNGKVPTLKQKKLIRSHGLDPGKHLVVKNTPEFLEVVTRAELKKLSMNGRKPRMRKLYKD